MPTKAAPSMDRLPFAKKVHLLSDRGLWPQLEALAKRYGWVADEVTQFIDQNLAKGQCPICQQPFYIYSKRVKYCSDRCRRQAAAKPTNRPVKEAIAAEETESVQSIQVKELCIKLVRHGADGSNARFYTLMIVQDLFGNVALTRRWGRDEQEQSQQRSEPFTSLEAAVAKFRQLKDATMKRGYVIADDQVPLR